MRPSVAPQRGRVSVVARTAFVLADPQVWTPAFATVLEEMGLAVTSVSELHELFDACRARPASLLVLAQRNAPFAVRACRAMRGLQEVPIMVVMQKEGDLIPVLDAGADDCVVARTEPAVFAARVRALLRRFQAAGRTGGVIVIRDMVLDLDKCEVIMNGRPVALTPTEFRFLAVLAQNAGKVVDPSTLLSAVHQHDYSERDAQNLVKVHIANLRRKLGDNQANNPYILCVRGFGYMLERRAERRPGDPLANLIEPESDQPPA